MTTPVFKFALNEGLSDIFLPTKAEELSTGYDVRADTNGKAIIINPGDYFKISLGFRSYCPEGWYYQLHPRSSSFTKKYMHNLIGIIDESWEGGTMFAGQYLPNTNLSIKDLIIEHGEKIGQIIPIQKQDLLMIKISNAEIDDLFTKRNSTRKSGGFGSTG